MDGTITETMTMTQTAAPCRSRLSLGTWIALVGALVVVTGGVTAGYSYVFATKGELKAVELKQADTGDQKLTEWRLKTLEVQVQNLQTRGERMDKNIVTLMERFRLQPEPVPAYQPLPEPPKPDEEGTP